LKHVSYLLPAILLFSLLLAGCTDKVDPNASPSVDGRPFLGSEDATVVLVEFSDFQCPVCARSFLTLKQVEAAYGDDVKIVYKHFPLRQIHSFAQKAAEANECAADQGRFFEYHDLLFQNQNALDTDNLKEYAARLSLNEGQFSACLDGGLKAGVVSSHYREAISLGVDATPTLYVNNKKYVGYRTFEQMKAIIDSELAATAVS